MIVSVKPEAFWNSGYIGANVKQERTERTEFSFSVSSVSSCSKCGVQTVGAQPLRVENPGHVAHARITQERDDHLTGTAFLGEAQRAGHVDSRREADKNPLLAQQLIDNAQRGLVGHTVGVVYDDSLQIFGD